MVKLAVFASGSGTNFENIVNRINDGTIKNAAVALLVVDKEHAKAIERAKRLDIPWVYVNPKRSMKRKFFNICVRERLT